MKKDKNNIIEVIKISIFAIIFLSLFIVLSYIVKPLNIDLLNISGFYGEKKNSMDMVYIGGSACFVYWAPLKAWEDNGITSYNFAADTAQAELYQYLVEESLAYQDPEVIVLDARAFQYRDTEQPPTEVAYRNFLTGTPLSWNRFKFIENNVPKYLGESTLSYHFDLIKYHGIGRSSSVRTSLKIMTGNYHNELKGFFFVPKIAKMDKYDFATEVETPMSDETNQVLDNLLAYLKTTNQKVLFVISPYVETAAHKENFNYVERKVTEAGFDFLDSNEYYDEMGLNFDTDFYNIYHVNIYGSEKYTTFLSNYLKKTYNLSDRSADNNYADDWNPLLNNWHAQVDATKKIIGNQTEGEK